uniref:Uncharacterized protein n=1 Tax=Arundo donax TaxID=35708 RepID=A0A0A9SKI9_ARUDO
MDVPECHCAIAITVITQGNQMVMVPYFHQTRQMLLNNKTA